MQVQKRDGRTVKFDSQFITNAINKAMEDVGIDDIVFPSHATEAICRKLAGRQTVTIEEIQTTVEDTLMKSRYPAVARTYIQYRHDRDKARDARSDLSRSVFGLMNRTDRKLMTENANKDSKIISTQRDLLAGVVSKYFAKHYLPADVLDAHKRGILHFHDLDYSPFFPMYNCMLIDAAGMMRDGFAIGNAQIETPRSIGTAATVITQIIAHVASQIYGGNTINRIDEVLAPYVTITHEKNIAIAKEYKIPDVEKFARDKTRKDVYDAVQCLEYQVNSLFSSNGQTPFCTFGFGLGESWEAALVQEMILRVRIEGLGRDKITPVFPKLVFALKRGLNLEPGDPLYYIKQLALECSSKRMYPDIVSYDQVVQRTGSFKFPMGCRSFLGKWTDHEGNEVHEGRNNLGVVTLNLPRIALDANGDQQVFWELLHERMKLVKDALICRADRLREVKASVAPILYTQGACGIRLNPDDNVFQLFENGRASISAGFIGLHEVSEILSFNDECHVFESKEKQEFLLEVLRVMRGYINDWKVETGLAFSLYGTPSESLCYRFFKLDQEAHPDHALFHDPQKTYWTNSFHLDVRYPANPYDKIDFEQPFINHASGGFISYGEYPNMRHNLEALEAVWDYAYDRTPYYGTNTPTDQCFECGFEGEFSATSKGYECPKCGCHEEGKISVIRRVCGYLGSPNARPMNNGKQSEVQLRVKHM